MKQKIINRQKPLTPDLEELIEELASNIQNYPETDRETIMQIARELNDKAVYGQKQRCKNSLIELLGYDTRRHEVRGSLQTIPENIIYLIDLGVGDIEKVVTRLPAVLEYSVENTMKPRVEYLLSIDVKEQDIGKIVARHPQVLEYSVENTMKPRIAYLKSLGVKEQDVGKVVTRLPAVLALDIENMNTRVEYLRSIGVKDKDIGKVVTRLPAVLEYSVENTMMLGVEYLKSIGVKDENIGEVVIKLPQVLELNIENNLKPTYEFLQQNFGVTVEDIIDISPLLSYSLEKRIKPRYEFLKSKGLEDKYKASTVMLRSDKRFCSLLKCPLEGYQEFKKEYLERTAA